MVTTVDALERRGLVRREQHPDDRRIRLVAVTAEGQGACGAGHRGRRAGAAPGARGGAGGGPRPAGPLLRALVAAAPSGPGSCV
jgi:hypothetical protein